ncbi:unnamed protein product, partial [Phaeothamnion confervicola]
SVLALVNGELAQRHRGKGEIVTVSSKVGDAVHEPPHQTLDISQGARCARWRYGPQNHY